MRPDGDCIGSQVALCRFLLKQGIEAVCVNTHDVPRTMRGFLGGTPFVTGTHWVPEGHVFITVDCSNKKRCGDHMSQLISEIFLAIDHHRSNDGFGGLNIIDDTKAATCEILTELFLPYPNAIDPVMAQALYIGIATDTGQFEYPSTSARVFELSHELMLRGADPAKAAQALYEQESFAKIKLLQRFLSTLSLELDGKACIGTLLQSDYDQTRTTREDSEGFVNYPRSIDGVEIAAVLEESPAMMKGSLRASTPDLRVDLLAGLFGGGGHAAAAGFTCEGATLAEFYPRFLKALKSHLESYRS